ncbi:hypothetical protein C2G38_2181167 [Gigaspora rosea]|uniref:Uncharacterized protein n=1 Tax=Gigaspora rosea TaxID=44941 RepID=A0A397VCY0_9GLOM|nr:hypothetical protein C2G38_2181167 [Gigaspora rosea]
MSKLLLWLYGETLEFVPVQAPSLPPKPQIKKNITSNTNDVDEITKGHNSRSCSQKKNKKKYKKKGKINNAHIDSDSDTSTNESESNSNSSSESSPSESDTSLWKKKSKTHKVKDAEAPPLASVPIFKKEKQSLKSPSQNEQSRLEKNIEKIIEKMLNKKFGTITAPSQNEQSRLEKNIEKIIEKMLNERFGTITTLLHPQNSNSKTLADSEDDEFIDDPMEIDFV